MCAVASMLTACHESGGGKKHEDHRGEKNRRQEEIAQADAQRTGVADRESPSEPGKLCECCSRQLAQFPRNHCGEEQEDRDEVTGAYVEAVVGPIDALYVEHRPLQYGERLIDTPSWIGLAKTKGVADREQHDQNRRDTVKNRCAHIEFDLAPKSIPEPALCP